MKVRISVYACGLNVAIALSHDHSRISNPLGLSSFLESAERFQTMTAAGFPIPEGNKYGVSGSQTCSGLPEFDHSEYS